MGFNFSKIQYGFDLKHFTPNLSKKIMCISGFPSRKWMVGLVIKKLFSLQYFRTFRIHYSIQCKNEQVTLRIGIACSLFRHGGVSLRTGTSKTPLPEFRCTGTSETPFFGVSAHRVPQKTSFPIRQGGVSLCTGTSKTPLP